MYARFKSSSEFIRDFMEKRFSVNKLLLVDIVYIRRRIEN